MITGLENITEEDQLSIFEQIKRVLTHELIEKCFAVFGSYWKKDNFYTLSPLRDDKHIGSFSIHESGMWYDSATCEGKGMTFADLYAMSRGVSVQEAIQDLLENNPIVPAEKRVSLEPAKKKSKPKMDLFETPAHNPVMKYKDHDGVWHTKKPTAVYYYRNKEGLNYFLVMRFEENGKKDFRPKYWTTTFEWVYGIPPEFENSRPLWGQDIDDGKKPVIIVEGEKACHALHESIGHQFFVTCWHGGAMQAGKVDIKPIKNRTVYLWPDNDEPGIAAMVELAKKFDTVRMIKNPEGVCKGWDAADCIAEKMNPLDVINNYHNHEKTVKSLDDVIKDKQALIDNRKIDETKPYKCAGYSGDMYYIVSSMNDQMNGYKADQLGSSRHLIGIAPNT